MKIYKDIKKCRICGNSNLKLILDLNHQPTANQLNKKFTQKELTIPLKLLFCDKCKTTQLSSTVNSRYLFAKYVWVTGTSNVAQKYCEKFAQITLKKFKQTKSVLEIASNDGTLLKQYKKKGLSILGVDPAKNIAKKANQEKIKTIANFFDLNLSKKIKKNLGKSDLIIARNVIPHVENIHSILKGIKHLITKDGVIAIEFHYLHEIIKGLQYDSIYHEHIYYFSLKSITNLFKKYGLFAFDFDKSPISGGSIVLYFSLKNKNKSSKLIKLEKFEKNKKLNNFETLKTFGKKCLNHRDNLSKLINKIEGNIYGYGASARSSTLLNFARINYKKIKFIMDKNKLKNGFYTPGTKIKIVKFNKNILPNNSNIIILAWNFKKEIINQFSKKKNYKFIVPLPNKAKLYENPRY